MKLGDLVKFSVGLVAGTMLLAATAQAAPLPPAQAVAVPAAATVQPAVVSQNEVDQMKPMQVRWHHHHHHHHHWHHHWHHHHWHHHR